jgi:hypothetical protein
MKERNKEWAEEIQIYSDDKEDLIILIRDKSGISDSKSFG